MTKKEEFILELAMARLRLSASKDKQCVLSAGEVAVVSAFLEEQRRPADAGRVKIDPDFGPYWQEGVVA